MKLLRSILGGLVLFLLFPAVLAAEFLTVCSFNIQFLGLSSKRDNAALAELMKGYDVVVVQELVAAATPLLDRLSLGTIAESAPIGRIASIRPG